MKFVVKNPIEGQCCAQVSDGPRSLSWHQCQRKSIIMREGHVWCGQHDPVAKKRRAAKTAAKYQETMTAIEVRVRRLNDYIKLRDTLRHVIQMAGRPEAMMSLVQAEKLISRIDRDEELGR